MKNAATVTEQDRAAAREWIRARTDAIMPTRGVMTIARINTAFPTIEVSKNYLIGIDADHRATGSRLGHYYSLVDAAACLLQMHDEGTI